MFQLRRNSFVDRFSCSKSNNAVDNRDSFAVEILIGFMFVFNKLDHCGLAAWTCPSQPYFPLTMAVYALSGTSLGCSAWLCGGVLWQVLGCRGVDCVKHTGTCSPVDDVTTCLPKIRAGLFLSFYGPFSKQVRDSSHETGGLSS
jgi:hypothetical protein